VLNLAPEISGARDFADTATIIDALDLVVSIDTAVAHLAGAMGKPCFLLIPGFATDWRWLRDRDDSPWYPGHHLYRSDPDQGWNATIDRLLADVAAAIEAQYGRSPAQG
jgi:ADP-heptose:LPS heptosyltransferase